ncbi:MAG: DUF1223 domain-containing protein [Rhodobacterales bacterium]|nr:MAG: DUF1223 domain-containing protein [Rhodobacterales bacterium]
MTRTRFSFRSFFLPVLWVLFALPGWAGPKPVVVVELFTSQGCSSCPPSDALIAELAEREDVLALALHVDYWDYIGWADTFARPEHTARQRAYAHLAGGGPIYTPQIVVSGVDVFAGGRPMKLAELIERHRGGMGAVALRVLRDAGGWTADVVPGEALPEGEYHIELVEFVPRAEVEILHGENAGRVVTYANIVMARRVLRLWDGQGTVRVSLPGSQAEGLALVVQAAGPGRVLAAARLR